MTIDHNPNSDAGFHGDKPQLQGELLGQLVPAVVHDLNNSISVLRGVLEIIAYDTNDSSARTAIAESIAASDLLRLLSSFAKDDKEVPTLQDPGRVLNFMTPLLRSFAVSSSARLVIDAPEGQAVMRVNERDFFRWVVSLSLVLLRSMPKGETPPRLELRLRVADGSANIQFLATTGAPEEARVTECIEHLLLGVEGSRLARTHRTKNSVAYELCFPADVITPSSRPGGGQQGSTPTKRILMVGMEAEVGQELEEMLRESGYRVFHSRANADPLADLKSVSPDLVLMEQEALMVNQSILSAGSLPPILVLGEGAASPLLQRLPNPCPPGRLLSAIAAHLGQPTDG